MKAGGAHLTYCTNIHAAEAWPDVLAGLKRHLPAIPFHNQACLVSADALVHFVNQVKAVGDQNLVQCNNHVSLQNPGQVCR